MTKRMLGVIAATVVLEGAALGDGETATAKLQGADGKTRGEIIISETANGLLLTGTLYALPPGDHAIHLHARGVCEPPFESAGPHFNPGGRDHGIKSRKGPHAGDLPNIHVAEDGRVRFEMQAPGLSLWKAMKVFDKDGTAVVIHAKPDDHQSQPAGDAGDRIACGVIAGGGSR